MAKTKKTSIMSGFITQQTDQVIHNEPIKQIEHIEHALHDEPTSPINHTEQNTQKEHIKLKELNEQAIPIEQVEQHEHIERNVLEEHAALNNRSILDVPTLNHAKDAFASFIANIPKMPDTRGHKGAKAPRHNLTYSPENYEYLKRRSIQKGLSMAEFMNEIIYVYKFFESL